MTIVKWIHTFYKMKKLLVLLTVGYYINCLLISGSYCFVNNDLVLSSDSSVTSPEENPVTLDSTSHLMHLTTEAPTGEIYNGQNLTEEKSSIENGVKNTIYDKIELSALPDFHHLIHTYMQHDHLKPTIKCKRCKNRFVESENPDQDNALKKTARVSLCRECSKLTSNRNNVMKNPENAILNQKPTRNYTKRTRENKHRNQNTSQNPLKKIKRSTTTFHPNRGSETATIYNPAGFSSTNYPIPHHTLNQYPLQEVPQYFNAIPYNDFVGSSHENGAYLTTDGMVLVTNTENNIYGMPHINQNSQNYLVHPNFHGHNIGPYQESNFHHHGTFRPDYSTTHSASIKSTDFYPPKTHDNLNGPWINHPVATERFDSALDESDEYNLHGHVFKTVSPGNLFSQEVSTHNYQPSNPDILKTNNIKINPYSFNANSVSNTVSSTSFKPKPLLNYLHFFNENQRDSSSLSTESYDRSNEYYESFRKNHPEYFTLDAIKNEKQDAQLLNMLALNHKAKLDKVVVLGQPLPRELVPENVVGYPKNSNYVLVDKANTNLKKIAPILKFDEEHIQKTNGFKFSSEENDAVTAHATEKSIGKIHSQQTPRIERSSSETKAPITVGSPYLLSVTNGYKPSEKLLIIDKANTVFSQPKIQSPMNCQSEIAETNGFRLSSSENSKELLKVPGTENERCKGMPFPLKDLQNSPIITTDGRVIQNFFKHSPYTNHLAGNSARSVENEKNNYEKMKEIKQNKNNFIDARKQLADSVNFSHENYEENVRREELLKSLINDFHNHQVSLEKIRTKNPMTIKIDLNRELSEGTSSTSTIQLSKEIEEELEKLEESLQVSNTNNLSQNSNDIIKKSGFTQENSTDTLFPDNLSNSTEEVNIDEIQPTIKLSDDLMEESSEFVYEYIYSDEVNSSTNTEPNKNQHDPLEKQNNGITGKNLSTSEYVKVPESTMPSGIFCTDPTHYHGTVIPFNNGSIYLNHQDMVGEYGGNLNHTFNHSQSTLGIFSQNHTSLTYINPNLNQIGDSKQMINFLSKQGPIYQSAYDNSTYKLYRNDTKKSNSILRNYLLLKNRQSKEINKDLNSMINQVHTYQNKANLANNFKQMEEEKHPMRYSREDYSDQQKENSQESYEYYSYEVPSSNADDVNNNTNKIKVENNSESSMAVCSTQTEYLYYPEIETGRNSNQASLNEAQIDANFHSKYNNDLKQKELERIIDELLGKDTPNSQNKFGSQIKKLENENTNELKRNFFPILNNIFKKPPEKEISTKTLDSKVGQPGHIIVTSPVIKTKNSYNIYLHHPNVEKNSISNAEITSTSGILSNSKTQSDNFESLNEKSLDKQSKSILLEKNALESHLNQIEQSSAINQSSLKSEILKSETIKSDNKKPLDAQRKSSSSEENAVKTHQVDFKKPQPVNGERNIRSSFESDSNLTDDQDILSNGDNNKYPKVNEHVSQTPDESTRKNLDAVSYSYEYYTEENINDDTKQSLEENNNDQIMTEASFASENLITVLPEQNKHLSQYAIENKPENQIVKNLSIKKDPNNLKETTVKMTDSNYYVNSPYPRPFTSKIPKTEQSFFPLDHQVLLGGRKTFIDNNSILKNQQTIWNMSNKAPEISKTPINNKFLKDLIEKSTSKIDNHKNKATEISNIPKDNNFPTEPLRNSKSGIDYNKVEAATISNISDSNKFNTESNRNIIGGIKHFPTNLILPFTQNFPQNPRQVPKLTSTLSHITQPKKLQGPITHQVVNRTPHYAITPDEGLYDDETNKIKIEYNEPKTPKNTLHIAVNTVKNTINNCTSNYVTSQPINLESYEYVSESSEIEPIQLENNKSLKLIAESKTEDKKSFEYFLIDKPSLQSYEYVSESYETGVNKNAIQNLHENNARIPNNNSNIFSLEYESYEYVSESNQVETTVSKDKFLSLDENTKSSNCTPNYITPMQKNSESYEYVTYEYVDSSPTNYETEKFSEPIIGNANEDKLFNQLVPTANYNQVIHYQHKLPKRDSNSDESDEDSNELERVKIKTISKNYMPQFINKTDLTVENHTDKQYKLKSIYSENIEENEPIQTAFKNSTTSKTNCTPTNTNVKEQQEDYEYVSYTYLDSKSSENSNLNLQEDRNVVTKQKINDNFQTKSYLNTVESYEYVSEYSDGFQSEKTNEQLLSELDSDLNSPTNENTLEHNDKMKNVLQNKNACNDQTLIKSGSYEYVSASSSLDQSDNTNEVTTPMVYPKSKSFHEISPVVYDTQVNKNLHSNINIRSSDEKTYQLGEVKLGTAKAGHGCQAAYNEDNNADFTEEYEYVSSYTEESSTESLQHTLNKNLNNSYLKYKINEKNDVWPFKNYEKDSNVQNSSNDIKLDHDLKHKSYDKNRFDSTKKLNNFNSAKIINRIKTRSSDEISENFEVIKTPFSYPSHPQLNNQNKSKSTFSHILTSTSIISPSTKNQLSSYSPKKNNKQFNDQISHKPENNRLNINSVLYKNHSPQLNYNGISKQPIEKYKEFPQELPKSQQNLNKQTFHNKPIPVDLRNKIADSNDNQIYQNLNAKTFVPSTSVVTPISAIKADQVFKDFSVKESKNQPKPEIAVNTSTNKDQITSSDISYDEYYDDLTESNIINESVRPPAFNPTTTSTTVYESNSEKSTLKNLLKDQTEIYSTTEYYDDLDLNESEAMEVLARLFHDAKKFSKTTEKVIPHKYKILSPSKLTVPAFIPGTVNVTAEELPSEYKDAITKKISSTCSISANKCVVEHNSESTSKSVSTTESYDSTDSRESLNTESYSVSYLDESSDSYPKTTLNGVSSKQDLRMKSNNFEKQEKNDLILRNSLKDFKDLSEEYYEESEERDKSYSVRSTSNSESYSYESYSGNSYKQNKNVLLKKNYPDDSAYETELSDEESEERYSGKAKFIEAIDNPLNLNSKYLTNIPIQKNFENIPGNYHQSSVEMPSIDNYLKKAMNNLPTESQIRIPDSNFNIPDNYNPELTTQFSKILQGIPLDPYLETTLRSVYGQSRGTIVPATAIPPSQRKFVDGNLYFVGQNVMLPLVINKNQKGDYFLTLDVSNLCKDFYSHSEGCKDTENNHIKRACQELMRSRGPLPYYSVNEKMDKRKQYPLYSEYYPFASEYVSDQVYSGEYSDEFQSSYQLEYDESNSDYSFKPSQKTNKNIRIRRDNQVAQRAIQKAKNIYNMVNTFVDSLKHIYDKKSTFGSKQPFREDAQENNQENSETDLSKESTTTNSKSNTENSTSLLSIIENLVSNSQFVKKILEGEHNSDTTTPGNILEESTLMDKEMLNNSAPENLTSFRFSRSALPGFDSLMQTNKFIRKNIEHIQTDTHHNANNNGEIIRLNRHLDNVLNTSSNDIHEDTTINVLDVEQSTFSTVSTLSALDKQVTSVEVKEKSKGYSKNLDEQEYHPLIKTATVGPTDHFEESLEKTNKTIIRRNDVQPNVFDLNNFDENLLSEKMYDSKLKSQKDKINIASFISSNSVDSKVKSEKEALFDINFKPINENHNIPFIISTSTDESPISAQDFNYKPERMNLNFPTDINNNALIKFNGKSNLCDSSVKELNERMSNPTMDRYKFIKEDLNQPKNQYDLNLKPTRADFDSFKTAQNDFFYTANEPLNPNNENLNIPPKLPNDFEFFEKNQYLPMNAKSENFRTSINKPNFFNPLQINDRGLKSIQAVKIPAAVIETSPMNLFDLTSQSTKELWNGPSEAIFKMNSFVDSSNNPNQFYENKFKEEVNFHAPNEHWSNPTDTAIKMNAILNPNFPKNDNQNKFNPKEKVSNRPLSSTLQDLEQNNNIMKYPSIQFLTNYDNTIIPPKKPTDNFRVNLHLPFQGSSENSPKKFPENEPNVEMFQQWFKTFENMIGKSKDASKEVDFISKNNAININGFMKDDTSTESEQVKKRFFANKIIGNKYEPNIHSEDVDNDSNSNERMKSFLKTFFSQKNQPSKMDNFRDMFKANFENENVFKNVFHDDKINQIGKSYASEPTTNDLPRDRNSILQKRLGGNYHDYSNLENIPEILKEKFKNMFSRQKNDGTMNQVGKNYAFEPTTNDLSMRKGMLDFEKKRYGLFGNAYHENINNFREDHDRFPFGGNHYASNTYGENHTPEFHHHQTEIQNHNHNHNHHKRHHKRHHHNHSPHHSHHNEIIKSPAIESKELMTTTPKPYEQRTFDQLRVSSVEVENENCDKFIHKRLGLFRSLLNWARDWVTETAVRTKQAISTAKMANEFDE